MLDQRIDTASSSVPDPVRQVRPSNAPTSGSSLSAVGAQSTIGKTLLIKGEITGSGSVHIEGKVEGSIELPEDRVTVGRNGRVSANIAAQDIVVLGEVLGSCNASDHLDIRCEGSAQAQRGTLGCFLRPPGTESLRKAWLPCFARSAGEGFGFVLRVGVAVLCLAGCVAE
jgi:cytoskeletal protein CcmA (bactofilin family)